MMDQQRPGHADVQVTAVIVTYRSRGTVGHALDALFEAWQQGLARCVVVDNASDDGTADYVAQHYPWVELIRSSENLGYGRGCNLGARDAQTPYVLFMNPDAVLDAANLRVLVDFMDGHADAGIAAPAVAEGEDDNQDAGLMLTPGSLVMSALGCRDPYRQRRAIMPGQDAFRTCWLCGAVMLVRRRTFEAVGGFDPRFFLYFEETDLCRRILAHSGSLWACGKARAWHIGAASSQTTGKELHSDCIAEHYYPSRYYYLVKHFGWVQATMAECVVAIAQSLRSVRDRVLRPGRDRTRCHRPFLRLPQCPKGNS